jgi:type IV secretory pathway ATPase VirB11/archaellum biosynthesis ATPase
MLTKLPIFCFALPASFLQLAWRPGRLMRNALCMRPDRIIIGEVGAGEAFDMLRAMNTKA